MKKRFAYGAAVMLPLLISGVAGAQPAAPATPAPPGAMAPSDTAPGAPATPAPSAAPASPANLSAADKRFVTEAAEGGIAEVQLAQMAQQKTQDATVKTFAQRMIDDHTPNNEQLVKLATEKGLTPPTEPNASQQRMMTHLQGLSGAKFDHAYLAGQIKAHRMMLKDFKQEAKNGTDPDLKAFATQTIPVIEQHLSLAQGDKTAAM